MHLQYAAARKGWKASTFNTTHYVVSLNVYHADALLGCCGVFYSIFINISSRSPSHILWYSLCLRLLLYLLLNSLYPFCHLLPCLQIFSHTSVCATHFTHWKICIFVPINTLFEARIGHLYRRKGWATNWVKSAHWFSIESSISDTLENKSTYASMSFWAACAGMTYQKATHTNIHTHI